MSSNTISWFEIYVNDMARARKFYETVLEQKLEPMQVPEGSGPVDMVAFPGGPESMQQYGAMGSLVKMDGVAPGGISSIVYFACEDCAVPEGKVKDAGGSIHTPKQSIGQYGFIVLAVDTEGNTFGLHSMK